MLLALAAEASAADMLEQDTGLIFSEKFGTLRLVGVYNYEKDFPGDGVGLSYRSDGIKLDAYVYDKKIKNIPSGVHSVQLNAQFSAIESEIADSAMKQNLVGFRTVNAKSQVKFSGVPYLHVSYSYFFDGHQKFSRLFLTCYKKQFIKFRATYDSSIVQQAEHIVIAFITMISNQMAERS